MPYFFESDWAPRTLGSAGRPRAQATARAAAAAEVTVAGATSSHHPRDGADTSAADNTVAGPSGVSGMFEWGASAQGTRIEALRGCAPSRKFFQPSNLHTQYRQ